MRSSNWRLVFLALLLIVSLFVIDTYKSAYDRGYADALRIMDDIQYR